MKITQLSIYLITLVFKSPSRYGTDDVVLDLIGAGHMVRISHATQRSSGALGRKTTPVCQEYLG